MKLLVSSVIILAIALSATFAFPGREGRIVGGNNATEGQFPYTVSMRVKRTNAHFCGGVIISNWWIISAAHCTISFQPDQIVLVAGTLNRITGGTPLELQTIINHELYDDDTLENDICVVKTKNEIFFTPFIQRVQMSSEFVGSGERVTLSGWGLTVPRPGTTLAVYLQWLQSTTINQEVCRETIAGLAPGFPVPDSVLCTVSTSGSGPCNADSGGPLTNSEGLLVGVLSFGMGTCDTGRPNGYPRISYYRSWIQENTEI